MGTPLRVAAVALAWAATLTFPAAGTAEPLATRTIQLGWSESAAAGGRTLMTVRVRRLVIDGQRWRLVAAFTNRSGARLRIEPRFALLVTPTRSSTSYVVRLAKRFTPRMPVSIASGATWQGTWHGRAAGVLKPGRFLRVGFDRFSGPALPGVPGFGVVTDNVKRL